MGVRMNENKCNFETSVRIKSISDYMEAIKVIKWRSSSNDFQEEFDFFFRGHSNKDYKLVPSLFRKNAKDQYEHHEELEAFILETFRKEAVAFEKNFLTMDLIELMTYAQHFGVPTRLLDFTTNPLIALYFACQPSSANKENDDTDGTIYLVKTSNLANSSRNKVKDKPNYSEMNTRKNKIDSVIRHIQCGENDCYPYPFDYIPYYIDARMKAQSSRFLIWGNDKSDLTSMFGDKHKIKYFKEPTLEEGVQLVYPYADLNAIDKTTFILEFIVPASMKSELLKQLSQFDINEKTLFPGLDGLGKFIKNISKR